MAGTSNGTRVIALVGPAGAGKTSLAEALLFAGGAIDRQGSVDAGTSVGDQSAEARARQGSTELNLMRFDYMADHFALIDAPGSPGFVADGTRAIVAADLAIVVVDPDPARAGLVEPVLRRLEEQGVPHAVFVNKVDQARGSIRGLLEALQPMSARPLLARQIPIREGEHITGFIDLALERAYHYRPGKASETIALPPDLIEREAHERFHMLEQLADHDDDLLEQLLSDVVPSNDIIFADLARETRENLVVPLLLGSALNGFGVRRLLKMLRHEAPQPEVTAKRIGLEGPGAYVFKIFHGGAVGRLALARNFGAVIKEGAELTAADGRAIRAGALFGVQGGTTTKLASAEPGDIVALAKAETVNAGELLSAGRKPPAAGPAVELPVANCAVAISTRDHKDDVRLSTALNKMVEEDPALSWDQDEALHEMLLHGVNDEHLAVALDRLKRRYGVAVDTHKPSVAYKESIRKAATKRGRHKKQSGGHGQFGDVVIEVRPLARGEGFRFGEKITGGAVPKQWIPAVEQGVRDVLAKGPLGFPVVDVEVVLTDGSYHSVDSSELAFRMAARIAMNDALADCSPYLLEPVCHVAITAPGTATSRLSSTIASRRGQILGIGPRDGWSRWDLVEAHLPEAELHGLDAELRSLSQGLASYVARFDHLTEVNGKLASEIARSREAA
jgi:elongation factor G